MDENQALIPVEQQTITFYGNPLIVVRLPDGRAGVVLRWLCENLDLVSARQIDRIKRTEAIADDLVYVRVETDGGAQVMATLVLRSVPFWLAGIDTNRVREAIRPDILRYQREVVDVLYAWASAPRAIAAPTDLVPAEPITKPERPAPGASLDEVIAYHQRMVEVLAWQRDIETWRGTVESRLEGVEAMTGLIPEILERLGTEKLTPAHQNQVKYYVQQLAKASGKHSGTIYSDLYTAFQVPRYQEIPDAEWDKVENWFKVQIERGHKK